MNIWKPSEWTHATARALNAISSSDGRRALRFGVLPSLSHQGLLRALKPDLVIDVGANRGQFSLDVVLSTRDARVLAFEPLQEDAMIYRRAMPADRCELFEEALADATGHAVFHVARARDSSSLLPIGPLQAAAFPGTDEVERRSVPVCTLDGYLDRIGTPNRGLLKIDVQGGEHRVLAGSERSLQLMKWVYVELSFRELYLGQASASEIIRLLDRHGFDLISISGTVSMQGMAVQADALFARR